jgi:hypothetical protein
MVESVCSRIIVGILPLLSMIIKLVSVWVVARCNTGVHIVIHI